MPRAPDNAPETTDEPTPQPTHRRRSVLKAAGIGAILPVIGGTAAARGDATDSRAERGGPDTARPPHIHSHFGYSGTSDDEIPTRLTPDETVGLHVDEERIDDSNLPELTVEFGAFHFDPLGLHVDPGTIVQFDFHTPEHTVTAYHPDQGRQRRVPDGVPAFSSTVNERHGFWLYRFDAEGVYDLFCSPHEWGGMGMRIVVGDAPGTVIRGPGRPPLPMTAALLGSGLPPNDPAIGPPELTPQHIVDHGPVTLEDLSIDLEVTITAPCSAD